jgi:hypothetical protein
MAEYFSQPISPLFSLCWPNGLDSNAELLTHQTHRGSSSCLQMVARVNVVYGCLQYIPATNHRSDPCKGPFGCAGTFQDLFQLMKVYINL